MPPKRQSTKPRAYGRQAEGKTVKSFSITSDLVSWAEAEAKKKGISFSSLLEQVMTEYRNGKKP